MVNWVFAQMHDQFIDGLPIVSYRTHIIKHKPTL